MTHRINTVRSALERRKHKWHSLRFFWGFSPSRFREDAFTKSKLCTSSQPALFNAFACQFIFCIGIFVGTWYNSAISLEPFRTRPWGLLACTVVASGLLYRIARVYASGQHLDLGMLAWSDATLVQMKDNLSA